MKNNKIIKVYIIEDEWFPVYEPIRVEEWFGSAKMPAIEISEDLYNEYMSLVNQFDNIQFKLEAEKEKQIGEYSPPRNGGVFMASVGLVK